MSERPKETYVTVMIRGRERKVRFPPPLPTEGIRMLKSIFESAEAMRLRDAGRE